MARIETYNLDPQITLEDKVIGSNFIGTTNNVKRFETANYTMGALKDFIGTGNNIYTAEENNCTFTMNLSTGTNWQVDACDGSSTTLALTINNNDVLRLHRYLVI